MEERDTIDKTQLDRGAGQQKPVSDDFLDAEEYLDSFSALKTSMSQGHDLRKKRKALEEYRKTLETLKTAHEDRTNIAQNYDALVAEQQKIIADMSNAIEKTKKNAAGIDTKIDEATDALTQLKRDQEEAKKPLEDELSRRVTAYDSAKDELKQVKAQRDTLDLFDGATDDLSASEAAHDQVVESVDDKRDAAKAALNEAQKALDAREKTDKRAQKNALDEIKKMNNEKEKLVQEAAALQKNLDAANDRIVFCGYVKAHPDETVAMQNRIEENEKTAEDMDEQIAQLASVHKKSKAASSKARAVVIGAIAFIVIVVIVFFIVSNK